jgi:hypothetical protein
MLDFYYFFEKMYGKSLHKNLRSYMRRKISGNAAQWNIVLWTLGMIFRLASAAQIIPPPK